MFDEKTRQQLQCYVYMLVNPADKRPFYVGKGIDNRIFDHLNFALSDMEGGDAKYDMIRAIQENGNKVEHVIIRHGLTEHEAFQIEASLIDALKYTGFYLSNKVSGHNSIERGLMTTEEVKRLYNADPLLVIERNCVIININKKYKRGSGEDSIYRATKEIWTIRRNKLKQLKYVLSEYKGLIVEVFAVKDWYEKERGYTPKSKKYGRKKIGFGFNGDVAEEEIRNRYINKSISHIKKRGAASVIRYKI